MASVAALASAAFLGTALSGCYHLVTAPCEAAPDGVIEPILRDTPGAEHVTSAIVLGPGSTNFFYIGVRFELDGERHDGVWGTDGTSTIAIDETARAVSDSRHVPPNSTDGHHQASIDAVLRCLDDDDND